jgi:hypothetical protein
MIYKILQKVIQISIYFIKKLRKMNEKTARWLQSIKIHPSHINEV